ncbi:MAG: hypothetical protein KC505_05550 [Myxococcales bacterium]|nr:hypothetical protein [Myxococcales bacterium]USN51440.1 MAG: hypothetical protein H6731_03260 [Myxococcales bacterium]
MEFMIPIYRMVHFFGFALLLGGITTSLVLVKKSKHSVKGTLDAWNCMHFIAAPGLVLLIISGILQSSALFWENFKDAGYMYAKVILVVIVLGLVFADMRMQKSIIRRKADAEMIQDMVKKRQVVAISSCIFIMLIMWLVSYRPF